jgi:hypothetical protein
MNVTIFGSCRQKAIERHHNVTSTQERLTYPHYTKEIIQAIQFCKNKDIIPLEKTRWCFRAGILSKEPISYDFKSEFDNTDIFVIEVASRIAYQYEETYVHHILEEEQYGFQERDKIVKRVQTDEEIEEDILTIRKLLYPKPFIIVPHIYTYTTGHRYELINLLKTLTSKMNIPFLDISSHLHNYENVYNLNEDRLMHFTEYGNEICSHIYKTEIENVVKLHNLKSITNVYYTSDERIRNRAYHGFGDYLRGCIALHQICTEKQIVPKFDFSHHMISNFLYCNTYVSEDTVLKDDITYVWAYMDHESCIGTPNNGTKHIFTNLFPKGNISDDCRKFIIKNILTPRPKLSQSISNMKDMLCIQDSVYDIVHIRVGDHPDTSKFDSIICSVTLDVERNDTVFITDNNLLNTMLREKNYKTTGKKCHLGLHNNSEGEVNDTLVDMLLMTTSRHIIQYSVYEWGSGFSNIIHELYNIPMTRYHIM